MRLLAICTLMLLSLTVGCAEKRKPVQSNEPLVPTAEERELLRAFKLDPNTEQGQKRIRRIREQNEKRKAARDRMTSWVEEANKRRQQ